MTTTYRNYINGVFVEAPALQDVTNPSNGELLAQTPASDAEAVDQAVAAAKAAQKEWAARPAIERAGYLTAIAAELRKNIDRFADYLVKEQARSARWPRWRSPSRPTTSITWRVLHAASRARSSRPTARTK